MIRHACDTPPCCTPDCFLLGTQAENIRDAIIRHRLNMDGLSVFRAVRIAQTVARTGADSKLCTWCGRIRHLAASSLPGQPRRPGVLVPGVRRLPPVHARPGRARPGPATCPGVLVKKLATYALIALVIWWAVQDPIAAAHLVHAVTGFFNRAASSPRPSPTASDPERNPDASWLPTTRPRSYRPGRGGARKPGKTGSSALRSTGSGTRPAFSRGLPSVKPPTARHWKRPCPRGRLRARGPPGLPGGRGWPHGPTSTSSTCCSCP